MARAWSSHPPSPSLIETVIGLGRRTETYVGCAPRRHRHGGADASECTWVLWADCDDDRSTAALEMFDPPPSLVIRSGIIRSARVQRGCGRAVRCWRHVVSEADWVARGGGRDGR